MILTNRHAFITGASQGIGLAIARTFQRAGATLSLMSRSQTKLEKVQAELQAGLRAIRVGDVARLADLREAYRASYEQFGKISILVANAAIVGRTPLGKTTEADFDRLLTTNLKAVFFTVQEALPYLSEGASIILVASLSAKQGAPEFSTYAATKAAVVSLAKCFGAELVSRKIRVNSLSPGAVRTPMLEEATGSTAVLEEWTRAIPMQRIGEPEEIAQAALFLASDASSFMTAADLAVDGGVSGISS